MAYTRQEAILYYNDNYWCIISQNYPNGNYSTIFKQKLNNILIIGILSLTILIAISGIVNKLPLGILHYWASKLETKWNTIL